MYNSTKAKTTPFTILLVSVFLLSSFAGIQFIGKVSAAGALTLTPTAQAQGYSVTVSGTGFGINLAVGVGFGAEVNVINGTMDVAGPFDTGTGPYTSNMSHLPIKPGTFRLSKNITSSIWSVDADLGSGTMNSTTPVFVNGTINYVTGQWTLYTSTPIPSSMHFMHLINYTYYQYNVTPIAGVTTNSSGGFTASITVPNVANAIYTITAVDTEGHIATGTFTVDITIPEGLTIGVMLTLSFFAVIVSTRYFRKRPKIELM